MYLFNFLGFSFDNHKNNIIQKMTLKKKLKTIFVNIAN